jgi:hypothetical protein
MRVVLEAHARIDVSRPPAQALSVRTRDDDDLGDCSYDVGSYQAREKRIRAIGERQRSLARAPHPR